MEMINKKCQIYRNSQPNIRESYLYNSWKNNIEYIKWDKNVFTIKPTHITIELNGL